MRKVFTKIIVLTLFMLFPLTFTSAITKVEFSEVSNGVINTTVHFDEGFVGGIDLVLKLSNNIDIKDFIFKSSFNNYIKDYNFDKNNHTLTIKVTAGGIGVKHNLLNEKKELNLGDINLLTNYKESFEYTLDVKSIKIVDNNWDSIILEEDSFAVGDKSTFKYLVGNNNNNNNNNPSSTNPNTDNNNDNNDNTNTNQNDSSTNNDNTNPDSSDTNNNNSNNNNDKNSNSSANDKTTDKGNSANNGTANDNSNNESDGNNTNQNNETDLNNDDKENNNNSDEDKSTVTKDNKVTKRDVLISLIYILSGGIVICSVILIVRKIKSKKINL